MIKGIAPLFLLAALGVSAFGQVKLNTWTTPDTGVAGVTTVSVTGSGFPAAAIAPTHVMVSIESTCGGTTVATPFPASGIRTILGTSRRVNFNLPAGVPNGTYFVQIADSSDGAGNFTSTNCSQVKFTGSAPILNSCLAGSSMGVLTPPAGAGGTVTAYVPKGYWTNGGATGVFAKNIEGAAGGGAIITPNVTNSCSSNPATGQTVCVADVTDVYLITGTSLNLILPSGSNTLAGFSGGTCNNCGVAVDPASNTAVINMGVGGGASSTGVQVLNLNTNVFSPPFGMNQFVAENISIDPTRSLVVSANEQGNFTLLQKQSSGGFLEYDSIFSTGGTNDSTAEDCSTGVAIAPEEFTNTVAMVNLNAPVLTPGSPAGTYSAPNSAATLSLPGYTALYGGFSAGLSGSAVAQGSGHLAVVTGEFGGNVFAVLRLPGTAGTGVPALADYAVAQVPVDAACGGLAFSAGFDPHTVTAYTSPNTGHSMAVFAGYNSSGVPFCLAVVDMNQVMAATRGGTYLSTTFGANEVTPTNLPGSAVTFFSLP